MSDRISHRWYKSVRLFLLISISEFLSTNSIFNMPIILNFYGLQAQSGKSSIYYKSSDANYPISLCAELILFIFLLFVYILKRCKQRIQNYEKQDKHYIYAHQNIEIQARRHIKSAYICRNGKHKQNNHKNNTRLFARLKLLFAVVAGV